MRSSRSAKLLVALGLAIMLSGLSAQVSEPAARPVGIPHDWSDGHILFRHDTLTSNLALALREPRVFHEWLRQNAARRSANGLSRETRSASSGTPAPSVDWSVNLGNGHLAPGMSPAKFGFDIITAPSCTADFVVFGLNVAGSGGQANLVAFNQLYRGAGGLCGTGGPSVFFAYNVTTQAGGAIATSPTLSADGTKIAFVESTGNRSIFHVLTWATGAGNGTSSTAPAVPGAGNTASMTTLQYAGVTNLRSSPWIDYNTDTAYVGANNGRIYKITGVFNGTPTLAGAPWPAVVSPGQVLTGPVLDTATGNLFVGDVQGTLFSVSTSTATVVSSLAVGQAGARGRSILDPPQVDSGNGLVYAVSSNDGTGAVLVQASTSNLTEISRAHIGMGGTGGTTIPLYDGSPDESYFTDPSTGTFVICGTGAADTSPWLYEFGFTGNVLNTTPTTQTQLLTSTRARCSPVTQFFNPNVGGGTEFFFLGLTRDCFGNNSSGCVISKQGATLTSRAENGGVSGIIVDNASTSGQASSIYFTNLAFPAFAVKLTQSGLQ